MDQALSLAFLSNPVNSKSQEKFVEYHFLKDLILEAASKNERVAISRSDFDAFGFDILLGKNEQFVLVQLKAFSGKARLWDVHKSILESDNGRIVLVNLSIDSTNIIVPRYYLFNRANCGLALARNPKVAHPARCKTVMADYIDITNNLLAVFS